MNEERKDSSPEERKNEFDEEFMFLKFDLNSDSLELSYSEDSALTSPIKSDISVSSSWAPSMSLPDSFTGDEDDILADINLPSLGEGISARKLISRIMNSSVDHDRQVLHRLTSAENFASHRGYNALRSLGQELRNVRDENSEMQAEILRLKRANAHSKEELFDLNISESHYQELSRRPLHELTTHECACLRAASIYLPLKQQLNITTKSLEDSQMALETATTTVQSQADMLTRSRKQHASVVDALKLDLLQAEEKLTRLTLRLEEQTTARREAQDGADRCTSAETECKALRQETASLRSTLEEQSNVLQTLSQSEAHLKDMYGDVSRERDLLSRDKSYLQKELNDAILKGHESERQMELHRDKAQRLQNKVEELASQLAQVQQSTRSALDDKMEKEVNRLREDYQKEMSALRDSSREIAERENRVLREVRQLLEAECADLKRQSLVRENQVSGLQQELNDLRVAKDREISQLLADVKVKAFEVTALGVSYEERMKQLKEAQMELDMARQEVHAHRVALLKLESESESKLCNLREDLSRSYETIRAYELMMHTTTEPIDISDTKESTFGLLTQGKAPLAVSVLASDPRRLRLLLETSERNLVKITNQEQLIAELRGKVSELQKQLSDRVEKIAVLESMVDVSKHPASYALTRLQEREDELIRLRKELTRVVAHNAALEEVAEEARREGERLRERLKMLLEQRAEIDGLRELLQTVYEGEQDSDNDGIEEASGYSDDGNDSSGSRWDERLSGGYEEDGVWHDNETIDSHPPPMANESMSHRTSADKIHSSGQVKGDRVKISTASAGIETKFHKESLPKTSQSSQQEQPQPQMQQQLRSTSEPRKGMIMVDRERDTYSSPTRHHYQQVSHPSDTSSEPASRSPATRPVVGGSPGSGVGGSGILSPAAVRAMTERNKGQGPSRSRVVENQEI